MIGAPNMDKLRQEMTILISEKPADDLDEQVISELVAFGMQRDEIIRLVLTKTHSSVATLYYLLLDVTVTKRRANGTMKTPKTPMVSTGGASQAQHAHGPGPGGQMLPMQQKLRPSTANAASASANANTFANAILAPPLAAQSSNIKPAVNNNGNNHVMMPQKQLQTAQHYEQLIQQQVQEQMNLQQQQQMERQEYRYRPKSASQSRSGANAQRPLSAYAGRR